MPTRPNRKCNYSGCKELTIESYCKAHDRFNTSKFRNKREKTHPWYNTKFWKTIRLLKLKENPLCEYCERKKKKRLTPANTVDHIVDWKTGRREAERWKLFSEWSNLASSCQRCHNRKTAMTNKPSYVGDKKD